MDNLEKVERLRERANVSYEDARAALNACDGDLLDAMVYLELLGKVKKPEQSTYSTNYEDQKQFVSVKEKVRKHSGQAEGVFDTFRSIIRGFIDKCRGNYFCAKKNGEVKFKIPVLLFLVLLVAFWKVVLPVMVVLLFLGFHYSFYGKDQMREVNDMMDRASVFAEQMKENFTGESRTYEDDMADGYDEYHEVDDK